MIGFNHYGTSMSGTAMAELLNVQLRESRGKRNAKRMRRSGQLPAVLYGHGKDSLSLMLVADEVGAAIRHGSKLVELKGKGISESALIRELQWDALGNDVLHIDFLRVDASERLTVQVAVELRGEAPGSREGGVVEHLAHQVEIDTPATSIPEKLHVNINGLQLGDSIAAGQIEDLPSDAKLVTSADQVIVQCVMPAVEAEEDTEIVAGEVEPEVISRKAAEDEEE